MTCLRSSKRTLEPSKTKHPLGKHPNISMPYKIIPRYGIGAQQGTIPIPEDDFCCFLCEMYYKMTGSSAKLDQWNTSLIGFCWDKRRYMRQRPLWSRHLPKHKTNMPRSGARETHRDGFCSSDIQTTDAVEGGPTPCWCWGESPL